MYADGPKRLTFALRSPDLEGYRHVFLRGRKLRLNIPRELRQFAYLTNFKLELGPARSFVSRTAAPRRLRVRGRAPPRKTTAAATDDSGC